ncbi:hypothetical protein [Photobacterium toruni]|uniref:hypothetical protein n=1 Tax=Photobacterium toruni TaxID=1935446 RepID=UPI0021104435|nr:hypothetical protein [Photobacterium toruni]
MERTSASIKNPLSFQTMQNFKSNFGSTNHGTTTANVMPLQQVETPFYAKAVKSKLRLSEQAKAKIGIFDEAEYVAPICNEVTSEYGFWGNLCKWSLKNDVINKQQINDFITASLDTQDDKALVLINDVMGSINKTAQSCLKRSEDIFSDIKLSDDIDHWYTRNNDYGWGFNIEYNSDNCFGDGEDENGDSNEAMAIRLTSESFVATAGMDISNYPTAISNKLYNMITDTAAQSYKSTTFGMIFDYGLTYLNYSFSDCDESIVDDFAIEITPEKLPKLKQLLNEQLDIEVLCNAITEIAPNAIKTHGKTITETEIVGSLYDNLVATKCNTLFRSEPVRSELNFKDRLKVHCTELSEMIDTLTISDNDRNKLNIVLSIFTRVHENFDINEYNNTNAWINGSDTTLYDSNFVSFGTDIEDEFLNNIHENVMSNGEDACLKLNLMTDESYIPMIKNFTLIDRALISMSDLL